MAREQGFADEPTAQVDLSVVIPTFNRAHFLPRAVASLLAQETAPELRYEVIYVDNGSSDGTADYLAGLAAAHPGRIRVFTLPATGGPAAPRNVGIRAAASEIIVLLDDDVIPDPDLVQRHYDYHSEFPEREAALVGSAYVPRELAGSPMSLFHEYALPAVGPDEPISYINFWTCNVSAKRALLLEAGLFDERFLFNEDIILGYRLHQCGMQLRCRATVRGAHWHQFDAAALERKGLQAGRWIWATTELLPVPEILDRYGVLSFTLGPARYLRRAVRRGLFRLLDNPLIRAALIALGATNGRRSRVSDLYYYLHYRRLVVAGYRQAHRANRAGRRAGRQMPPWQLVRELSDGG